MNIKKAIKILEEFKDWRIGETDDIKWTSKEITQALDAVIYEAKISKSIFNDNLELMMKLEDFLNKQSNVPRATNPPPPKK